MTTNLLPRADHPRASLSPPMGAADALTVRPPLAPTRVLVATRGGLSDPALGVADAVAARSGGDVRILTVHQPRIPVPTSWQTSREARCEPADRNLAAALLLRVRNQRRAHAHASRWPVRLEVGDPPRVIAQVAAQEGAQLVMVGLGREQPADRKRGSQTAARLALLANVPILAVAARMRRLPRTALVVTRTVAEENAVVRALLPLLGNAPTVRLARAGAPAGTAAPSAAEHLAGQSGCTVQRVAITGDVVHDALALADRLDAEVIATATSAGSIAERAIERGAAVPLLSLSRRSVLVVPVGPTASAGPGDRAHAAAAWGGRPPAGGG